MVLKNIVGTDYRIETVEAILGHEFMSAINKADPDYTLSIDSSTGMDTAEIAFRLLDRTVIVKLPSLDYPSVQFDFAFTDSYEAQQKYGSVGFNIFTEDRQSNNFISFAKQMQAIIKKLPLECVIFLLGTTPGRSQVYLTFAAQLQKLGYYVEAGGLMEESM